MREKEEMLKNVSSQRNFDQIKRDFSVMCQHISDSQLFYLFLIIYLTYIIIKIDEKWGDKLWG